MAPAATTVSAGDALVVGAGLAGLFTALKLAEHGKRVTVLAGIQRSGGATSTWAQGGIAAPLGPDDSQKLHAADTIAAGDGLVDPTVAQILAEEAAARIADLDALGVPFDKKPDGSYALGREGAHSRNRIVHVGGDKAGAAIMQALRDAVTTNDRIHVVFGWNAADLLKEGETVVGAIARGGVTADAPRIALRAPATVLATGGLGHLFAVTTNPPGSRGHGLGLAARGGARVADVEFVQFHPTAIDCGRDPAPLATEALRGEGAILITATGQRLMEGMHPLLDLAPRDIVARAIASEIAAGGSVFLDCRNAIGDAFPKHFPTVFAACIEADIDPVEQPIPVAPAVHYHMGGVETGLHGRTSLPGLYACGEVACSGAHGANRLASNSLLEGVVFGARIAADIAAEVPGGTAPEAVPNGSPPLEGPDPHAREIAVLRETMTRDVGVVRDAASLSRALDIICGLDRQIERDATGYRNMLAAAKLVAAAALRREESRGGHTRRDFPATNPALAHRMPLTLADADATAAQAVSREAQSG